MPTSASSSARLGAERVHFPGQHRQDGDRAGSRRTGREDRSPAKSVVDAGGIHRPGSGARPFEVPLLALCEERAARSRRDHLVSEDCRMRSRRAKSSSVITVSRSCRFAILTRRPSVRSWSMVRAARLAMSRSGQRPGFVSDFLNKKPSRRPLLGIYAKA